MRTTTAASNLTIDERTEADTINTMSVKAGQKTSTFNAIFKKVRGGYTAWIEEMPGVISEGKTRSKAEENLTDALELMLETNRMMSLKDAVGDIERSTISLPVRSVA